MRVIYCCVIFSLENGAIFVFWAAAILDLCKCDIFMVNINLNNNKTINNGSLASKII